MPTDRFYRLPEEKKEAIRRAAVKEFTRAVPEEASINKVIQDADISRGSFYTYFENKYDLLGWLFHDKVRRYQDFYKKDLREGGGDIWSTMEKALKVTIDFTMEGGFLGMIENMMESKSAMDMFRHGLEEAEKEGNTCSKKTHIEEMYQLLDKEKCPIDFVGFCDLMEMHMITIMMSLKKHMKDGDTLEAVTEFYNRRTRLLRYGVEGQNILLNKKERQE